MSTKRFLIAFVCLFVATTLLGYVIHGIILQSYYQLAADLYRDALQPAPLLIGNVAFCLALVWIYSAGVTERPWVGQGVRFGLALWLLWPVPNFLIDYAGQPLPGKLVAGQILLEFVDMIILGLAVAFLCQKSMPPAQASA